MLVFARRLVLVGVFIVFVVIGMLLSVELAGLAGVVIGVGRVAGGDVGVVGGGFNIAVFVVLGSLTMMLGRLFVVTSGVSMMLSGRVGRFHLACPLGGTAEIGAP